MKSPPENPGRFSPANPTALGGWRGCKIDHLIRPSARQGRRVGKQHDHRYRVPSMNATKAASPSADATAYGVIVAISFPLISVTWQDGRFEVG